MVNVNIWPSQVLGTQVFCISYILSIYLKYFIFKKNLSSPPSYLDILESAGKVSLFQHQSLDQYYSIECLKYG